MTERSVSVADLIPLFQESLAAGNTVRFSPRGTSMLPMLRQGKDTVILSTVADRLQKYDIPLYQRDDGAYVLHRVVKCGETYTCIGDNQYALESGIRPDQVIAVVSAFTRGGKYIPVTNPGYCVYCRLWHWSRPVRRFCSRVKRKIKKLLR